MSKMEKEEEKSTLNNFQALTSWFNVGITDGVNTRIVGTGERINLGDKIRTQATVTTADSANH